MPKTQMASTKNYHHLHFLLFLIASTTVISISSASEQSPLSSSSPAPSPYYSSPSPWNAQPDPTEINEWCGTVPHPAPCKSFTCRKPFPPIKNRSDFRRMAVQSALTRALEAQNRGWNLGCNCQTDKKRAALTDCVKLYDYTILQLNRTLEGLITASDCTVFDAQTWLSSALTNLETCMRGSADFNLTGIVFPHVEYNVSDLISNSLAINEGMLAAAQGGGSGKFTNEGSAVEVEFPNWMSRKEKRLLLARRSVAVKDATFVVAKDGLGKYRTVQAAINAAAKVRQRGRKKFIYIKRGVYEENISVNYNTDNVVLIGDGLRNTVITGRRSTVSGYTTYNAPTGAVDGSRFIARGITFENTAGPRSGQAPAFRSGSDLSVYFRCAFVGYQDTLFVHSQRQFYKECYIYGTIDIIFGNAAVVFQNCIILVRKPARGQGNVVTAQGRLDPNQNTGIVIHNSRIMPDKDLEPVIGSVDTYLGRPWKPYSRTVIMKTYIERFVNRAGWLDWNGRGASGTVYYAEHRNMGKGSKVKRRVTWPGFHILRRADEVSPFSVSRFIAGSTWLPPTGVPFSAGV